MPSSFKLALLISSIASAAAFHGHTIVIPSTVPRPSSIAWDPTAQHFVVGSALHPIISSVSDASVAETIVSDPLLPPNSSVSSILVDNHRRRLLVALRDHDAVAAYDLRSPRVHRRIFFSALPDAPSGITLDPANGFVFVTGANSGVVWRVDLQGIVSDFSKSAVYGGQGLSAAAYVRNGFLLVVQGSTGRVFKVDEDSGASKEVFGRNGTPAPNAEAMALMADGSAVFASKRSARIVQSGDGWAEAAVRAEVKVEEGSSYRGVAVRQGKKVYVLVSLDKGKDDGSLESRIEEVEWDEEGDMLWAMVLVGFGLVYFLYWRFQMGQLVSNMNKKRA